MVAASSRAPTLTIAAGSRRGARVDPLARLAQARFEDFALTLYLGRGPALDQSFHHALLKDPEKQQETNLDAQRVHALHRELLRVRRFLDFEFQGGKPLAVFSSEPAGFLETRRLPEDVGNRLWVDRELHLEPLQRLLERHPPAVIAVVEKERVRIFILILDRVEPLADLRGDPVKRHRQGGWSDTRYQRRADLDAESNLKAAADWMTSRFGDPPGPVYLAGPIEARASFVHHLTDQWHDAVVSELSVPAYLESPELDERIRSVARAVEATRA